MDGETPSSGQSGRRAGKSRWLPAVALGPILMALLVLVYHFAAREDSDWVLVAAFALCAAAVTARLIEAVRPRA